MQKAEQQIAEKRKIFTRARSTDRDCFGSLENPLPGAGERPAMAAGRLALLELQNGDGSLSRAPRSVPTDFGPPNLQMSIEAL
jgi:hypothetical protein